MSSYQKMISYLGFPFCPRTDILASYISKGGFDSFARWHGVIANGFCGQVMKIYSEGPKKTKVWPSLPDCSEEEWGKSFLRCLLWKGQVSKGEQLYKWLKMNSDHCPCYLVKTTIILWVHISYHRCCFSFPPGIIFSAFVSYVFQVTDLLEKKMSTVWISPC